MSSLVDSGTALRRFAKHSLLRVSAWVVSIVIVAVWLSAAVGLAFERGVALLSAVLVVEPAAALVLLFKYDRALARAMSVAPSGDGDSAPSPPGAGASSVAAEEDPLSEATVQAPAGVENGNGGGSRSPWDHGGGGREDWLGDESLEDATGDP